ncbi:APH(3') family aminoglycoside O-phosphotransferase [Deinococcus maricopensis]|uniref:APH(3') family aminoglycoside O-phosphotransferase n=1 Tax=Deinococcus maricopensis TaxID=309887 RepID=UPI0005C2495C|nr:APH(3') family aminoglycoside O-phosphotransferase [Deinococcus maricopensis]
MSDPNVTNLTLPASLRAMLSGERWEPVTVGESDADVYRSSRFVLKRQRSGDFDTLRGERERLGYFAGRVRVPDVVAYHVEDDVEYLVVERLPGTDMSHPALQRDPRRAAELLARALREVHALPVHDCPFDRRLRVRLADARERVRRGLVDEDDFDDERRGRRATDLLNDVEQSCPADEDLVVTHGDAYVHNVMVADGELAGLIDVGRAGVADRHMDLALAAGSLASDYGEGVDQVFLEAYGREHVDEEKLRFYRLLDEFF